VRCNTRLGAGNADGEVDIADVIFGLSGLFTGGPWGICRDAELEVDRTIWRLKKQMMGVCLSSKEGIKTTDVIAALNSIEGISVEESLLIGARTCHVIHLGRAINYVDFIASIGKSKLEVDDLIWSHWEHGWDIDEGEHGDHDMGMVFIEVIED
jgi:hypothetical protein